MAGRAPEGHAEEAVPGARASGEEEDDEVAVEEATLLGANEPNERERARASHSKPNASILLSQRTGRSRVVRVESDPRQLYVTLPCEPSAVRRTHRAAPSTRTPPLRPLARGSSKSIATDPAVHAPRARGLFPHAARGLAQIRIRRDAMGGPAVTLEVANGVAVVTMSIPPVNALAIKSASVSYRDRNRRRVATARAILLAAPRRRISAAPVP